jgi:hypothetical protein
LLGDRDALQAFANNEYSCSLLRNIGANLTATSGVESERFKHRFELRFRRSALGSLYESGFEHLGLEPYMATLTATDDKALRSRIPRFEIVGLAATRHLAV